MTTTITDSTTITTIMDHLQNWPTITTIEFNAHAQSISIKQNEQAFELLRLSGGQVQTQVLSSSELSTLLTDEIADIRFINLTYHGVPMARFTRQAPDTWTEIYQKNIHGEPIDLNEAKALLSDTKGHC